MHVYMRLIQLFPFIILLNGGSGGYVPPGFSHVVTLRGNFVVTARGNLIAKEY